MLIVRGAHIVVLRKPALCRRKTSTGARRGPEETGNLILPEENLSHDSLIFVVHFVVLRKPAICRRKTSAMTMLRHALRAPQTANVPYASIAPDSSITPENPLRALISACIHRLGLHPSARLESLVSACISPFISRLASIGSA